MTSANSAAKSFLGRLERPADEPIEPASGGLVQRHARYPCDVPVEAEYQQGLLVEPVVVQDGLVLIQDALHRSQLEDRPGGGRGAPDSGRP